jgi:protein-disulfide isomerase
MCAAEQDAYLDYHETLYDNQSGENQGAFSDSRLKDFAKDLGLNTDQFNECLDSGKYEPTITQMKAEGQALGITGTPTFVINGQVTSMTAQGYDLLKKQLNAAVEQAE